MVRSPVGCVPRLPVLKASRWFSVVRIAHAAMGVLDTSSGLGDCHNQPAEGKCARRARSIRITAFMHARADNGRGGNHVGMIEQRLYDVLAAAFAAEGVDTHFTLLGDGNMHWATVLAERHGVRTIHARHEHCACEMASAYAHVTGRVGVASVTHGPGITQIMTALTTAARGDIPLIVFASEAPTTAVWTIQQIDQAPLVRACGVEYIQIQSINHALDRLREAFCVAQYERRPVVLGVSDDLQRARVHNIPHYVPSSTFIPRTSPCLPDDESVRAIADLIAFAERPIILAGRGAILADAKAEVLELAERCGALLATTLPARGLFDGEEFSSGIGGGWSSDVATELFAKADLVIAIG